MDRRNKHLNSEERGVIFAEHQRGNSQRGIGRLLGRPASTISRELARGRQDDGGYCPQAARRVYDERRARCRRKRKLVEGDDLYRFVHGKLVHLRWSPEQIANRLRRMKPDDPAAHVSHETIYAAIYAQPRGGLKDAMIEALRQSKPKRGNKRRTAAASSMVPVHVSQEAQQRLMQHKEGDAPPPPAIARDRTVYQDLMVTSGHAQGSRREGYRASPGLRMGHLCPGYPQRRPLPIRTAKHPGHIQNQLHSGNSSMTSTREPQYVRNYWILGQRSQNTPQSRFWSPYSLVSSRPMRGGDEDPKSKQNIVNDRQDDLHDKRR
jgi:hypothetical protein